MIKTLKITTLAAAILCTVLVVSVAAFGLKGDPAIEDFLDAPTVVDGLKNIAINASDTEDQVSPLVQMAQAFALRIDPPPPPKPPEPPTPPGNRGGIAKPQPPRPPVGPKGPIKPTGKFELIATCRYEEAPHKSLALLSLPAKGYKWFRVGENVEHLVVADVQDGHIVMEQGAGGIQSIVEMKQAPSTIRSLLADKDAPAAARTVPTATSVPGARTVPTATTAPTGLNRPGSNARYKPKLTSSGSTTISRVPSSTARLPRKVPTRTIEQRKASLDDNIDDIKKIMAKPDSDAPESEARKENDALMKLLKLLEDEKKQTEMEEAETDTE